MFIHNDAVAGPIPAELAGMKFLRWLDLHNNQLTGEKF